MMRPDYNPAFPNQEEYPQSMPGYWGGYQQPMPYPHQSPIQDSNMHQFSPQYNGGLVPPFHEPYQQPAIPSYQPVPQQAMNAGAAPGNSVMQPMQPNQTMPPIPPMYPNQQMPVNQYMPKQAQGFNPFDNPLQPTKRPPQMQQQVYNPYPKQQFMQKQQPSGIKSVMNQFKTQDGSMDITKMMNTAGQMMNTVSQVSSMVKGVGGFFKV